MSKPGVGAAQRSRDARVRIAEAPDVGLVDDGLVPGPARGPIAAPVEVGMGDDRARREGRAVAVVGLQILALASHAIGEDGLIPADVTLDGPGVGVEEQLGRVAAQAALGIVRAVDPEAIALAG